MQLLELKASAILSKNTGHQKKLGRAMVMSVFGTFLLIITSLEGKNITQRKGSLG
jgi:hypothetical protein